MRLPLDLPTQVALRLVRAWTDESGEFRTYEDPTPSPTNSTTPERLVNMPENVADIYIKMMYALVGLWFVGVAATLSYSCKNFDTCTDKKRKQLSLRASLYGISNTPVPLRFGRNQVWSVSKGKRAPFDLSQCHILQLHCLLKPQHH